MKVPPPYLTFSETTLVSWGASLYPGKSGSLGSALVWLGVGVATVLLWYLAGIEPLFSKFSLLLGCPFLVRWLERAGFCCGLFYFVCFFLFCLRLGVQPADFTFETGMRKAKRKLRKLTVILLFLGFRGP